MMASRVSVDDFRAILEDVLDESNLKVVPETTAKDIDNWDSLNHVRLLVRIEERYGIDLPIGELESAKNVGELLAIVNRLVAQKVPA